MHMLVPPHRPNIMHELIFPQISVSQNILSHVVNYQADNIQVMRIYPSHYLQSLSIRQQLRHLIIEARSLALSHFLKPSAPLITLLNANTSQPMPSDFNGLTLSRLKRASCHRLMVTATLVLGPPRSHKLKVNS